MQILLTNDDGIYAPGLAALTRPGGRLIASGDRDGTIKIWRSRFLHVEFDLLMRTNRRWAEFGVTPLTVSRGSDRSRHNVAGMGRVEWRNCTSFQR